MSNLDALVHLKEFSVRNNRLEALPIGLEQRTNLTFLAVSKFFVSCVARSVHSNLFICQLANNRLSSLLDFSKFPRLATLYVNGNPDVGQVLGLGELQHLQQLKVDLDCLPNDLAAKAAPLLELFETNPSAQDIEFAQSVVTYAKTHPIRRAKR
jgi:Leucine-rich repeat (LRR) protein